MAPATYLWGGNGTALVVHLATNESVTVSNPQPNVITFTLSGAGVDIWVPTGISASGGGDGTATIDFDVLNDLSASISIDNSIAGTGVNDVTFSAGAIATGSLSVDTTQAALATGNIVDSATIQATTGGPINLTANGLINGGGTLSTTGTLTTSSTTGTTLNGANTVGSFKATNTTSGDITLTNTGTPLTITGITETGGGTVFVGNSGTVDATGTIADTAGTVDLTASATLSVNAVSGTTVNLTSNTGAVDSIGGLAVAASGTLTVDAATGMTLNTDAVDLQATNSTSGIIDITQLAASAQTLTVTGTGVANDASTGAIDVTNLGSSIAIITGVGVTSTNGEIDLAAQDFQISGSIDSGTARTDLENSSSGLAFDLGTNTAGTIGLTNAELQNITASVLQIGSDTAGTINVSAAITEPAGWFTLTLTNNSTITEAAAGSLQVSNLSVNSTGPVTLTSANDAGSLAASTTNALSFDDGANLLTIDTVDGDSGVATANSNISLIADSMTIVQPVNAGTASVTLEPSTPGLNIDLGTNPSAGNLGLAQADLDNITAGELVIGSATAGNITNSAAITDTGTGWTTLELIAGTGAIVAEPTGSVAAANLALAAFNGIGTATASIATQVGNLVALNAPVPATSATVAPGGGGTGYALGDLLTVQGGSFVTPAELQVTSVSGGAVTGVAVVNGGAYGVTPTSSVSAIDTTTPTAKDGSFDVNFAQFGNPGIITGIFINNTGALTIGYTNDPFQGVTDVGNIDSINLTSSGTMSITTSGEVINAAAGDVTLTTTSGDIDTGGQPNGGLVINIGGDAAQTTLSAAGNIALGVNGTAGSVTGAGPIVLNAGGNITVDNDSTVEGFGPSEGVTATAGGNISILASTLTGAEIITANNPGSPGGNISLTTGVGGIFTLNSGTNGQVNSGVETGQSAGDITINADNMVIDDPITAGSSTGARVTLEPVSTGQLINLGGTNAVGTLGLTNAGLNEITAGTLQLGTAGAGTVTVSNAIALSNVTTLDLETGGGVSEPATGDTIAVANLDVRAVSAVSMNQNNDATGALAATVTRSGQGFSFNNSAALTIGTVDGLSGITTRGGAIDLTADAGALTVNQAINAGNAPVLLVADTIAVNAAVKAGTNAVILAPHSITRTINLGTSSAGSLSVTSSELAFFTGTFLDIGRAADSSTIQVTSTLNGSGHFTGMFVTTSGAVTDNGSGVLHVSQLDMKAAGAGIGSQADPLQISVTGLFATTAADNSNIFLSATGTALIVGSGANGGLSAGSGTITLSGGAFGLTANNQIAAASSLTVSAGTLNIGAFSDTIHLLTLSSNATLAATINGAGGSPIGNLTVNSFITLNNATLNLSLGESFTLPPAGTVLTFVHNDGHAFVIGQFAGLPNGSTVVVGGHDFSVSYFGGASGCDITLT